LSPIETVRTDDILVHPRDGDLIVASHGRSIYIGDDVTPLQQFTPAMATQDAVLFDVRPAIHFYIKAGMSGEAKISVSDATGRALCETSVAATAGIHRVQWTLVAPLANAGGGRGGRGGAAVPAAGAPAAGAGPDTSCASAGGGGRGGGANAVTPGGYLVKLTVGGREYTRTVQVLEDRWMNER
jgi:hypothetical protein